MVTTRSLFCGLWFSQNQALPFQLRFNIAPREVPYSAGDLPWLPIVCCLLLYPACSPGRHSVSQFCSEMLLLTSDWPRYHCCLDVLFTDLGIHPSGLAASSLSLSSALTFSACLLIPLVMRTCLRVPKSAHRLAAGWISLQPLPVSYVVCTCALLLPLTPPRPPAHACSAPSSADSANTMDSLDCSHAFSVLMDYPSETPPLLSQYPLSCCSPQVSCLFGTLDLVSGRGPHSLTACPVPTGTFSAHAAAASLADSADEIPIPRFPPCSALVLCDSDDEVPIPCPRLCRLSSCTPLPLFTLNLPHRLAAVADAPLRCG
jgi:hypothetical protein